MSHDSLYPSPLELRDKIKSASLTLATMVTRRYSNFLVHTVFRSASLSCHNFIGHNIMFGKSFVRDYSGVSLYSVNLIREFRDYSLFVPGFLTCELNRNNSA